MKVYEALAKAFVAEGTTGVFGMMGDANQHWLNALDKKGVPMYEVRHEGCGLTMASVKGALTGQPGVVTTTSGPGITQLATTMVVASRSSLPLVAFCGDTRWGNEDDLHYFDQARFAAAIEAGFIRITAPDKAYEAVQQAFYRSKLEPRPYLLSAPLDVQLAEFDDFEEYTPSSALFMSKAAYPNPESITEAVDIIARSQKIVLIAGHDARSSGAEQALQQVADRTGAIVATSLLAMNWPQDVDEYHVGVSGLYSTRAAMELFQEADCVIAAGASLNHYTTEHGYLYPDATIIHIDSKPQVVMGDGRSADCYVQADARLGLEALDTALEQRSVHHIGYRTAEVKERLASALEDPKVYELEPGTLDPRDAYRLIDQMIPNDMGLVLSGSHALNMGVVLLRGRRPYTLINKFFGSMSKGIGQVIGACVVTDKKPTVLIEGDLGFMMHVGEFETACRYELPVLVIIMNDQAMGAELHKAMWKPDELNPDLCRIATPDLGAAGVVFGGRGHLVRTIDELRAALSDYLAKPGPMLVDVRISSSVESIQTRRLHGDDSI